MSGVNGWLTSLSEYIGGMSDELDNAKAENAKMREQIHWLKKGDILHVLTDQEYIDQCERERLMQVSIDALDKENAALRGLVRDMYRRFHGVVIENWSYSSEDFYTYEQRMRELGVDL